MKTIKKRYIILLAVCFFMVIMNITARLSTPFADFYVRKIFPVITNIFSAISGIFPFSVGEILIIIAVVLILVGIPLTVILLIFGKSFRKKTVSTACFVYLFAFTYILTTETMNCFIMYRCTPFAERYLKPTEHTTEKMTDLYSLLIEKANELSEKVTRDENDCFIYNKNANHEAQKAMKKAGDTFGQLKGFYPNAKPVMFSYFMSQSNLSGIYFPFSLEANYNDDMYNTNLPETICHELAHLKGFIQEDEANFISFYATTQCSDDFDFQYSGYLEALEYVHNQIYKNEITGAYYLTDTISDKVIRDWFKFLPETYWEDNKEKEVIPTETVSTASNVAIDTNIKMNGRTEGIISYSLMTELLLDFYYG